MITSVPTKVVIFACANNPQCDLSSYAKIQGLMNYNVHTACYREPERAL